MCAKLSRIFLVHSLLIVAFAGGVAFPPPPPPSTNSLFGALGLGASSGGGVRSAFMQRDCAWRHNITDSGKMSLDQMEILENCLYYYLLQREAAITHDYGGTVSVANALHSPPPQIPLRLSVSELVVRRVETAQKSSDFFVHGDLFVSWNDSRLRWNETEWKMEYFDLHDSHHIWTPTFDDISECIEGEGCESVTEDIQLTYDGSVVARVDFHYPASCHVNFHRYPEETNDCCVYLSMRNAAVPVKYIVDTREKTKIYKKVALKADADAAAQEPKVDPLRLTSVVTSVWTAQEQTVRVVPIRDLRGDHLELCVHAKKEMSTLKIALRIPVTIATMLMLVAPLFGDLRTQAFVKLFTLTLQTLCFLFLCQIAPANGFGGSKPKIYTFYEFLFFITFLSILVTLVCLALSRLRRNVPASHSFYLTAKVINHFLCCIEPEPTGLGYQRHLEDSSFDTLSTCGGVGSGRAGAGGATPGGGGNSNDLSHHAMSHDYTYEWRQIYIAANNLFSGVCFSIFCFVILFEIM